MKVLVVLLFAFFISLLTLPAQVSFQLMNPPLPSPQIDADIDPRLLGNTVFEDIDLDGDLDLISIGTDENYEFTGTYIYLNDGQGNMTEESGHGIIGLGYSDLCMADIDSDGDADLYTFGYDDSFTPLSYLYLNDGAGNFTESPITGHDLAEGMCSFADVDMDGDMDLLTCGFDLDYNFSFIVQLNDGAGGFDAGLVQAMEPIYEARWLCQNLNNISAPELLIYGINDASEKVLRQYNNDGTGIFTEQVLTNITGAIEAADIADIDADGDMDLLAAIEDNGTLTTSIYLNDGTGEFTLGSLIISSPYSFGGAEYGCRFLDANGDGSADALQYDSDGGMIFLNDGNGNFDQGTAQYLQEGLPHKSKIMDLNADGADDLFVVGDNGGSGAAKFNGLYVNQGTELRKAIHEPLEHMTNAELLTCDLDGDGDMDVMQMGMSASTEGLARAYINVDGDLLPAGELGLTMGRSPSFDTGDIDADGDPDLIVSGLLSGGGYLLKLYANDGSGTFTEVLGPGLMQESGQVRFVDMDADADLDILFFGLNDDGYATRVYLNDGTGAFNEHIGHGLPLLGNGFDMEIADFNGDSYPDMILCYNASPAGGYWPVTSVYASTASLSYQEVDMPQIPEFFQGDFAFVDLDGDSDLDLLATGSPGPASLVFENDGQGNFQEHLDTGLAPFSVSHFTLGDLDSDGDEDLVINGLDENGIPATKAYANDGDLYFTEWADVSLEPMLHGRSVCIDFDGDGKKDLLMLGYDTYGRMLSRHYRNTTCQESVSEMTVITCGSYTSPTGQVWTSSGIYEEVLMNQAGCDSLITIDLEILAASAANIEVSSCGSYISPTGQVWTSSGIYEEVLMNQAGCDSVLSIDLTILELNTLVTQVGDSLLASMPDATYQWVDCTMDLPIPGATSQAYVPLSNGLYACEISTADGCSEMSDCVTYTVLGLSANQHTAAISIYPNPFTDQLMIDISQPADNIWIRIYDLGGKKVFEQKCNSAARQGIYPRMMPGIYLIECTAGDTVYRKTMVKQ